MSCRDEMIEEIVEYLSDRVAYNTYIEEGDLTELIEEIADSFELSLPTAKACTLEALTILRTH